MCSTISYRLVEAQITDPQHRAGPVVDPDMAYQQALRAGLVVHQAHPMNAETPLSALTGIIVPGDRHYVRNHFHIPDLDPATWRLRVDRLAARPLSLSLAQLQSMASHTVVATLECAGNGRSSLDPAVPVPGWYGVASVKWLTEIELTSRAFDGHFHVDRYHIDGEPVTLQAVRSLITEPRHDETREPGDIVVRGLAWSGAAPIREVEVSIDGQPWRPALLSGERRIHSWQRWHLPARLEGVGSITVRARATDIAERTQPDQPHWNPLGYAANSVQQVRINLRPRAPQAAPRAQGLR